MSYEYSHAQQIFNQGPIKPKKDDWLSDTERVLEIANKVLSNPFVQKLVQKKLGIDTDMSKATDKDAQEAARLAAAIDSQKLITDYKPKAPVKK